MSPRSPLASSSTASVGALNIATGEVHSFRHIAEQAAALSGKRPAIKGSPRSGPMPHGGYRPFDIAACRKAFPDFEYTALVPGHANIGSDFLNRKEQP